MKCPRCDDKMKVTMDEPLGKSLMCNCGVLVTIPFSGGVRRAADVPQEENKPEEGVRAGEHPNG